MLAKRYNVVQMRQFFSSKSCVRLLSLPMRGEWIEIISTCYKPVNFISFSPCGESGLKSNGIAAENPVTPVSPHAGRVD